METTDDRYLVIIGKPVLGQWSVAPINIWMILSAYFTLFFDLPAWSQQWKH